MIYSPGANHAFKNTDVGDTYFVVSEVSPVAAEVEVTQAAVIALVGHPREAVHAAVATQVDVAAQLQFFLSPRRTASDRCKQRNIRQYMTKQGV